MTNCNNYDDDLKKLQEDNDRLRQELGQSEAARKAGEAFLRTEVKKQWVFKMNDGTVRSLTDADMEAASARLQALQVQQQLGTQALSIANQGSQSLLALFR